MNNSYNGHLVIVFALEHYNPLNMIRAFGEQGINPVYISVKRRYEVATKSKYISELHRVDSVKDGFLLLINQYGRLSEETGKKPYILFSDDKSVGYFDLHFEEWKDKFITYNAGRNGRINEFMDKYEIQQCAKRHGFNVLDSYVIKKGDPVLDGLWYPIITKDISPNLGSWKSDVFICQNKQELVEALEKITCPLVMWNSQAAFGNGCRAASEIEKINENPLAKSAACMTYYERGYLNAVVKEPERTGDGTLWFPEENYFKAYYQPFFELFADEQPGELYGSSGGFELELTLPWTEEGKRGFRHLQIGTDPVTIALMREGKYDQILKRMENVLDLSKECRFCGEDGIWVGAE